MAEAVGLLERETFDVALIDIRLGAHNGLDLCERVLGHNPNSLPIIVTGYGSLTTAVQAMRVGAVGFLRKPIDDDDIEDAISTARKRRPELVPESSPSPSQDSVDWRILGESNAIRRVRDLVGRAASSDATVLLSGETGTGKELVARAIHDRSPRSGEPFVAINCAGMPLSLLESELFGHAKGAFTDAKAAHDGLFVAARRGTIFLDEIGDIPSELQPKLLRVLQERRVRAIGADVERLIEARFVVATHRDLEQEIEGDRFRADLFYRINVFPIEVPALRDRGGDVLIIAARILANLGRQTGRSLTLSPEAENRLLAYAWPGNVRELQNTIESAAALARTSVIMNDDLPEKLIRYEPPAQPWAETGDDVLTMSELERRYLLHAIHVSGGNKSRAAKLLGLDRATIYRKLEEYDNAPPPPPSAGKRGKRR